MPFQVSAVTKFGLADVTFMPFNACVRVLMGFVLRFFVKGFVADEAKSALHFSVVDRVIVGFGQFFGSTIPGDMKILHLRHLT